MNEKDEIKNSMRKTIQTICDKVGPRSPCSEQETDCAKFILKSFNKYTDDVQIENFYCHPGSYRAAFRIPMIIIILITILYWIYFFYPNLILLSLSLVLITVSIIVIQANLMRNIEFIDPLFKKKASTNVYGRFKPNSDIKKIIVIGGHHDSNWEFPILKKWPKIFTFLMAIPIISSFLMFGVYILKSILFLFSIQYLIIPLIDLIILFILTILSPILIYTIFNCVSREPVMGADDNLTSISIIIEIAKFLSDIDGLKNTEIWLVSHGCEEIGDRGSKRFSQKHLNDLKDALVINIDMVGGKNSELKIDIIEVRSLIKLSKNIGEKLSEIASELGIPHSIGNVVFFTDSMAYSQNDIKACSIVGTPKKGFASHYHTVNDTIDKLEFNNLWDCYRILTTFIRRIDEDKINFD